MHPPCQPENAEQSPQTARILDIGDGLMLGLCPDGRKIWLDGPAVPGDVVSFTAKGKGGHIDSILEPAPDRVIPPCAHFSDCPGCQLQPLPYPEQLRLKTTKLRETLRRIGGFSDLPPIDFVPALDPYGSRNKLDFSLDGPRLGYRGRDGLVEVEDCPAGDPRLRALLPCLRAWLHDHPQHRLHRLLLRVDGARQHRLLLLRGELRPAEQSDLLTRLSVMDPPVALCIQADWKSPWRDLNGEGTLVYQLAGERYEVRHDQFFQVNDPLAGRIIETALQWLEDFAPDSLLDLFCGVGAFGLPARRFCRKVWGVDLQPGEGASFVRADLRSGLPQSVLREHWDAMILDPPREGLPPRLLKQLCGQLHAPTLLYLSCHPGTLARDLKALCAAGGYELQRVTGFDLFPQTTHLETLTLLRIPGRTSADQTCDPSPAG